MALKETGRTWHVAYTFPKSERKAYDSLQRIGVDSFVPMHYVLRKWSDRIKKLEMPLFPNYIFIYLVASERHDVLKTPEIVRYVCFDGKPAIVSDTLVDSLKKISTAELEVSDLRIGIGGVPVRIVEGPFAGSEGLLVKKNGRSRFVVRVKSLQSSVSLEISASSVVPLECCSLG
jgi:transcription antitermination factor NusG